MSVGNAFAVYNYATWIHARGMMQAWTDSLDALEGSADAIPLFEQA